MSYVAEDGSRRSPYLDGMWYGCKEVVYATCLGIITGGISAIVLNKPYDRSCLIGTIVVLFKAIYQTGGLLNTFYQDQRPGAMNGVKCGAAAVIVEFSALLVAASLWPKVFS